MPERVPEQVPGRVLCEVRSEHHLGYLPNILTLLKLHGPQRMGAATFQDVSGAPGNQRLKNFHSLICQCVSPGNLFEMDLQSRS